MSGLLAPSIVIVDVDAGMNPADVAKAAAALMRQVLEEFSLAWGTIAAVRAASHDKPAQPGEWQLQLRKVPTIEGALGFHDRQDDGTPILYVFPELCASDGASWTSCASHEILEALADPLLRRCVQTPIGAIMAMEDCDAVEQDTYVIDGVQVSNFCLPAWFEPNAKAASEKYDYLGLCTAAFEVRPGGYSQTWDPDKGWTQAVNGMLSPYRAAVASLGLGRAAKRAAPGAHRLSATPA